MYGFGSVVDVRPVYDNEGAGYYLGKHLGKSGSEPGWRKVTCSRNYLPVVNTDEDLDWVLVGRGPGEGVDSHWVSMLQFQVAKEKAWEVAHAPS